MSDDHPVGDSDVAPFTEEHVEALTEFVRDVLYPAGREHAGARYKDKSGRAYRITPDGNHVRDKG